MKKLLLWWFILISAFSAVTNGPFKSKEQCEKIRDSISYFPNKTDCWDDGK